MLNKRVVFMSDAFKVGLLLKSIQVVRYDLPKSTG